MVAKSDELIWLQNLRVLIELRTGLVKRRANGITRDGREAATLIVFPGELVSEVVQQSPILAQRDRCWGDASTEDNDEGF